MNILLTIAYDGTNYAGWQRQENAVAVQQVLEEALVAAMPQPCPPAQSHHLAQPCPSAHNQLLTYNCLLPLTAASRTDAGVHALGQMASFIVDHMPIPLDKFPQVINSYLPGDIAVQKAQIVPDDFNPRFHARAKTYCYQIYNAPCPNPLHSRYSAFVPNDLDVARMAEAAAYFIGTYDFAAFCASGSSAKTTVRTIFSAGLTWSYIKQATLIKININGDGFLYNMVRIIAGTLLYVGMGKLKPGDIPEIIESCDRTRAGKTMPPEGLTLLEVEY